MVIIYTTNKISEWVVRGDFLLMDLHSEESERMLMDEDMFSFQSIWSVLATSYPWIAIFLKMYLQK